MFDIEALLDTGKRRKAIKDLLFESEHMPMSVSLADILDRTPEHISSKDPKELIGRFWEASECRAAAIREDMRRYIPQEIELLPKQQQKRISQWCFQTLVLGSTPGVMIWVW